MKTNVKITAALAPRSTTFFALSNPAIQFSMIAKTECYARARRTSVARWRQRSR
jgi:hypothetical protein